MSYGSIPQVPPPYATRPSSPSPQRRGRKYRSGSESETAHLLREGEKLNTCINTTVVLFIVAIVIFSLFLVGISHYDNSVAKERKDWDRELQQRRREEQQRIKIWQEEEEARQRLGLYWGDLTRNDRCTAYDKREYWAPLQNTVPYEYNWQIPCREIPNVINGRTVNTSWCYSNPFVPGEVIGHWVLDGEPLCAPYWNQFKDKGCAAEGSGHRTIEAHLENIHWDEDGENLCASTPHDFYGLHFDAPHSCVIWGKYEIFGIWHINDPNC